MKGILSFTLITFLLGIFNIKKVTILANFIIFYIFYSIMINYISIINNKNTLYIALLT